MEINDAIETIKYYDKMYYDATHTDDLNEIIKLLKDGKKYKRIVKDIKRYIIDRQIIEENFCLNGKEIIDLVKWIEGKYFSKEKSDKKLSELVDKIIKVINQTSFTCEEVAKMLTPKREN